MMINSSLMDESAILEKTAPTRVQIALGFTSCDFPIIAFFHKLHSHPCDYVGGHSFRTIPIGDSAFPFQKTQKRE